MPVQLPQGLCRASVCRDRLNRLAVEFDPVPDRRQRERGDNASVRMVSACPRPGLFKMAANN